MRYTIERFAGLQQQVDEHLLPTSATPDAVNMDAEEQDLQVAAGYAPYTTAALAGGIETLAAYYRRNEGADDTRRGHTEAPTGRFAIAEQPRSGSRRIRRCPQRRLSSITTSSP